jgi:hypothetical protein
MIRPWCSLKREEVHLKAYANGHAGRIGSANSSVSRMSAGHQALGYETSVAVSALEERAVDLPLRLDDAGASSTTPQGQPQQNVVYI